MYANHFSNYILSSGKRDDIREACSDAIGSLLKRVLFIEVHAAHKFKPPFQIDTIQCKPLNSLSLHSLHLHFNEPTRTDVLHIFRENSGKCFLGCTKKTTDIITAS